MVRAPEEGGRGDAKRHQRHRLLSRKARGEKGAKKTIGRGKGNHLSPLSSARGGSPSPLFPLATRARNAKEKGGGRRARDWMSDGPRPSSEPPPAAPPTHARACAPSLFSYVPPLVL